MMVFNDVFQKILSMYHIGTSVKHRHEEEKASIVICKKRKHRALKKGAETLFLRVDPFQTLFT